MAHLYLNRSALEYMSGIKDAKVFHNHFTQHMRMQLTCDMYVEQ